MIQYFDPSKSIGPSGTTFKRWKVYGVITYPTGDPTLANFYFANRILYYQEFNGGFPTLNVSGSAFSYAPFAYNLTGPGGRNSFRNRIVADINNLSSVLGTLTVTNNVTLAYGPGLDPNNPSNTIFRFLIEGTCTRTIPNNIVVWQEVDITTGNLPFNNNCWSLFFYI